MELTIKNWQKGKRVLRPEDRRAVKGIVRYLESQGMQVELRGSATKGDRRYNDVDLLATGSFQNTVGVCQALMAAGGRNTFVGEGTAFNKNPTEDLSYAVTTNGRDEEYMNEFIEYRFGISAGNTRIDVGVTGNNHPICSVGEFRPEELFVPKDYGLKDY